MCPACKFTHTLCDIETLNRKAHGRGVYDVTAISFHAYPYVQDNYALMAQRRQRRRRLRADDRLAQRAFALDEMKNTRIAVPGHLTTAYLALKLFAPGFETEVVPFDQIIPQVLAGKYEAGLIIHEGQLTYVEVRPAAHRRSRQVVARR